MTISDQLFFTVFNAYKDKLKRKSNTLAVFYILLFESSVILLLGVFFAKFFNQMKVTTMSSTKAWVLFGLVVVILYFKNWIKYSGKKRKVLNAKSLKVKTKTYSIWIVWLLPIGIIALALVLLNAL
ncbi:hypothetical protein [Pontimicrobium sp. IMCC45349]|uniref:hypothetical protein n=1 Tax=Pontimicrobium sp. IMCC45349 TaxID=3391574 RepID=UPI0039A07DFF